MCSVVHKDVNAFRGAVTKESERLSSLCCIWQEEIEEDAARTNKTLTEDIIGDINVAIGKFYIHSCSYMRSPITQADSH